MYEYEVERTQERNEFKVVCVRSQNKKKMLRRAVEKTTASETNRNGQWSVV